MEPARRMRTQSVGNYSSAGGVSSGAMPWKSVTTLGFTSTPLLTKTKSTTKVCRNSRQTVRCGIVRPERYTSQDWLRNLANFPRSLVLRRIGSHIMWNLAATTIVAILYEYNKSFPLFHLSTLPHTLLGTAASLLLVFRTNAAYDRFWEGRKLWGSVVNRTRNLASTAMVNQEGAERLVKLTALFSVLMEQHLRGRVVLESIPIHMTDNDKERLRKDGNKPYRATVIMREEIKKLAENQPNSQSGIGQAIAVRGSMEEDVTALVDCLGACERIVKTPVPLEYSRHTSRFLSVYGFTLPLILVDKEDFLVIFSVLMVTWALFAIQEIGHMIEDPFTNSPSALPLQNYTATICGDLSDLIEKPLSAVPEDAVKEPATIVKGF